MDGSHKASSSKETMPLGGGSGNSGDNNQTPDPNAKEWSVKADVAPKEDRVLFMTFSNGHPIANYKIRRFFKSNYGDCLERVYVHRPGPKTPQFGKLVFKTSWIPLTLTQCGKREIKFLVDGKTLRCKKYDPSKGQVFETNSTP